MRGDLVDSISGGSASRYTRWAEKAMRLVAKRSRRLQAIDAQSCTNRPRVLTPPQLTGSFGN
jgi:hypothetical protein